MALPTRAGSPARVIFARGTSYHLAWSPDGRLLFVSIPTAATATHVIGRTYVVPLPPGQMFPPMPAGGFDSAADLAQRPDVRVIEAFDAAPSPDAQTYAFSRSTVQRNLYRIPVP